MTMQFNERLKQACDNSKLVPEMHQGRYVAIAKRMNVSEEAVRKWFTGESRPRFKKMAELASWLNVDEGWLALGVSSGITQKDKRDTSSQSQTLRRRQS